MVKSQGGPRAVLFDLDNTLIDRDGAVESMIEALLPNQADRAKLLALDGGGYGDRESLFRAWTQLTGQPMDQDLWTLALCSRLEPDRVLLESLQALSERAELAILSNGGGVTQRAKIKAARLNEIFEPNRIFVSGEIGQSKPDPCFFHHACQQLGVEPEEVLMVGDRDETDGLGARAAGLAFLRVARA